MKLKDVHSFFQLASEKISFPVKIFITGGAAAIAFGVSRATEDIDFEVELSLASSKKAEAWRTLETVFREVQISTGIIPQFSEDIDRWSSIALPFKRSKRLWKLGQVEVRLLDPLVWSVGKLARCLASDESDVVEVFKRQKPREHAVVRIWGNALAKSPASTAQSLFRDHVRRFLDKNARSIWGPGADAARLFSLFLSSAQKPGTR
jgi:hypothetical protein